MPCKKRSSQKLRHSIPWAGERLNGIFVWSHSGRGTQIRDTLKNSLGITCQRDHRHRNWLRLSFTASSGTGRKRLNIPVAGYRQSGEMETVIPVPWKPLPAGACPSSWAAVPVKSFAQAFIKPVHLRLSFLKTAGILLPGRNLILYFGSFRQIIHNLLYFILPSWYNRGRIRCILGCV